MQLQQKLPITMDIKNTAGFKERLAKDFEELPIGSNTSSTALHQ
jgi:hypothetical protein